MVEVGKFRNVLFNLDQYGHSHVERATISEIMRSTHSVEIFYTFAIESLLTFLSRTDSGLLASQLGHLDIDLSDFRHLDSVHSNSRWLGAAEKIVFDVFHACAQFVSPFSIHNPTGWRYWLIHFANSYRARQVYNDILHDNSTSQAHFGRSGLNMLSYNPTDEGALYLFDVSGRKTAIRQLESDIPRVVFESGDAMNVGDFYATIYNTTPAHKDDIHQAMMSSEDLQILTPSGGERRKAGTITAEDTVRVKNQKSFFPLFRPGRERTD